MDFFTFLLLFALEEQNSLTVELVYKEQVHSEVMATVNKWYLLSLQTVAHKYFTVRPESVSSAAVSCSKLNGAPRRNFEVPSFLHLNSCFPGFASTSLPVRRHLTAALLKKYFFHYTTNSHAEVCLSSAPVNTRDYPFTATR